MRISIAVGVLAAGVLVVVEAHGELIVPPDRMNSDFVFCSDACPTCKAGEVCARQVHPLLAPVCVPRCASMEDCPDGVCLDPMLPDGRTLNQPICLHDITPWCGSGACSFIGELVNHCVTDRIRAVAEMNSTVGLCGFRYVVCPLGCVTLGGIYGECRTADLAEPLDQQAGRDLAEQRDLGVALDLARVATSDPSGCSCSLSPTATTGLNLAGIALCLGLFALLLRRGKG